MELVDCKHCGKPISESAKTCPHCGGRSPYKSKRGSILATLLFATLFGVPGWMIFDTGGSWKAAVSGLIGIGIGGLCYFSWALRLLLLEDLSADLRRKLEDFLFNAGLALTFAMVIMVVVGVISYNDKGFFAGIGSAILLVIIFGGLGIWATTSASMGIARAKQKK